jgi:hypothetical protein
VVIPRQLGADNCSGFASTIEVTTRTISVSHESLAVPRVCDESVKLVIEYSDDAGTKPVGFQFPAANQSDGRSEQLRTCAASL